jgi:hypothetical protein
VLAGESLLHDIMTSQNSSTLHEHHIKQGVCFGREFALKFDQKPYFKAGIFLAYIRTILSPHGDILSEEALKKVSIQMFTHHITL